MVGDGTPAAAPESLGVERFRRALGIVEVAGADAGSADEQFALVGADIVEMTTEQVRAKMSDEKDGIKKFHTRKKFDQAVWDKLQAGLVKV